MGIDRKSYVSNTDCDDEIIASTDHLFAARSGNASKIDDASTC
jgi:hypothetical protein